MCTDLETVLLLSPRAGVIESSPGIEEPKAVIELAENSLVLPPLLEATAVPDADDQPTDNLNLPTLVTSPRTRGAGGGGGERKNEATSLPQIEHCHGKNNFQSVPSELANYESEPLHYIGEGEGCRIDLPALIGQLSELEFSSGSSSSDDSTSDEEEEDSAEEKDKPSPYPDLGAGQLPWPAVLQYLRESESEASKYFSLGHATDCRELDLGPAKEVTERQRTPVVASSHEVARPVVERMSRECDFCGQNAAQWSVLHATTGAGVGSVKYIATARILWHSLYSDTVTG